MHRPGRPVVFGFGIANPGRFPVTLISAFETEDNSVLQVDEVRIGPEDGELMWVPETAILLVNAEIKPGRNRMIWVVGHVWTCAEHDGTSYTAGSSVGYNVAQLRYRIGPIGREQLLDLPTEITVLFPVASSAPCS